MLNKSKRLISVFMIMISLFCVAYMFAGCKKDKSEDDDKTSTPKVAVELTSEMISLEYSTVFFDRNEKKPSVVVKVGGEVIDSAEYSVSYSNNIEIGTATATVSAKEDSKEIKGSASKNFSIIIGMLADISPMGYALYSGASNVPNVNIPNAHNNVDYTLSWEYKELLADDSTYVALDRTQNDFVELGMYRVTAVGKDNYQGTVSAVYGIYRPLPAIQEIANKPYDGTEYEFDVVVNGLTENEDYVVSYEYKSFNALEDEFISYVPSDKGNDNFVEAGIYRVVVTGIGEYGGSKSEEFEISAMALSAVTISSPTTYDGSAKTVTYNVEGLTENRDYQVSWKYRKFGGEYSDYYLNADSRFNFINAGEYQLIVTGIGNYSGSDDAVFVINKASMTAQVSRGSYIFNNENNKISVNVSQSLPSLSVTYYCTNVAADINNLEAESWKLYKADDILNVGVHYIYARIEETDNFNVCNSEISSFEVYADELNGFVDVSISNYVYDGVSHSPYPNIVITSEYHDEPLVNGQDYEIMWWIRSGGSEIPYTLDEDESKNFVNAGYYSGRLYAKGNYQMTGAVSKSINFTISPASFDSFSVERISYTYGQKPTKINLTNASGKNGVVTLGATIVYMYQKVGSSNDWQILEEDDVLDVGNYYIKATATKENYNREDSEGTKYFSVYKATLTDIELTATNKDISTLTLNGYDSSAVNGTVTYLYNTTDSTTGGKVFRDASELEAGTYYVYAVISGMTNYNNFTTNTVEIIISENNTEPEAGA